MSCGKSDEKGKSKAQELGSMAALKKGLQNSPPEATALKTFCEECESEETAVSCRECEQNLCINCDFNLHRRGKRASHQRFQLWRDNISHHPSDGPKVQKNF